MYSDLFSDLTQNNMAPQPVTALSEANGVPVQVTVNHESFGVCAIQERSDNWSWGTYIFLQYHESLSNMESDVLSVCQGFKAYLLEYIIANLMCVCVSA